MKPYERLSKLYSKDWGKYSSKYTDLIFNVIETYNLKVHSVLDIACGTGILASELHSKNFEVSGIDISEQMINVARENGGGDDRYWSDYLVPKLIDRVYTNTNYTFWKDGELIKKFFGKAGMRLNNGYVEVNTLDKDLVPKLPPEILTDFKYYSGFTYEINPKDSINFKGNIYLLVDKVVYSSAEGFASFAKSTGFATLIGERTGGDGIGSDPLLEILPNSGYIFRFTKEMGLVEDGTCNMV